MKRGIVGLLGIVIVSVVIYGFVEYTRGKKHLKNERPEFAFAAIDLISLFEEDPVSANEKFTDRLVSVKGTVTSMDASESPAMLFMKHPETESSIKFSMDSLYASDLSVIKVGNTVNIKGICAGGEVLDLGLGADILITSAVLENN